MRVRPATGPNGLPKLVLSHPAGSSAEVFLQGAHVASWIPEGGEALFLSREARFQADRAIRGGVPVVFPQFAELGPLPKHGFARLQPWTWHVPDEDAARAVLRLDDSEATRAVWPHAFRAELAVALGEADLALTLAITNTGPQPFAFAAALHTYLRVADVRQASVEGLQGLCYRDRAEQDLRRDHAPALHITEEMDRLYLDTPAEVRVEEASGRTMRVSKEGFADTVVWNPWQQLAAKLPDLADDEYREMLCVEAAQVGEPVTLAPGGRWQGTQRLAVG